MLYCTYFRIANHITNIDNLAAWTITVRIPEGCKASASQDSVKHK